MRYAGLSEPFKLSRCYERDGKTKKTKSMQMMKIRSISAGSHHAAMVDELGRVFSWGAGTYGRTGGWRGPGALKSLTWWGLDLFNRPYSFVKEHYLHTDGCVFQTSRILKKSRSFY